MDKKMKLVNYDELHEIYVDFYNHAVKEDNRYEQQIYEIAILALEDMPTIEAQPVKHGQRIDHEELIGIFGTLCDYMVDNGRCDVFCPYADTKDKNDECEAWRTIQKIRQEG